MRPFNLTEIKVAAHIFIYIVSWSSDHIIMIIYTVDGWICDFPWCFKLCEPGKLSSVCLLFWVPQSQTATSSVQIRLWPLAGLGWCQPWSTSCLRASRKIIAKYMAAGLFRTTFRGPMPHHWDLGGVQLRMKALSKSSRWSSRTLEAQCMKTWTSVFATFPLDFTDCSTKTYNI